MHQQRHQGGRTEPGHTLRGAEACRSRSGQALPHLGAEAADIGIIQILRQRDRGVGREPADLVRLSAQVAAVAGLGLAAIPACFNATGEKLSCPARCIASVMSVSSAANSLARTPPTQPQPMPGPVSRRSALSERNDSRYSDREVNIRYGSLTPCVVRSSTITPR